MRRRLCTAALPAIFQILFFLRSHSAEQVSFYKELAASPPAPQSRVTGETKHPLSLEWLGKLVALSPSLECLPFFTTKLSQGQGRDTRIDPAVGRYFSELFSDLLAPQSRVTGETKHPLSLEWLGKLVALSPSLECLPFFTTKLSQGQGRDTRIDPAVGRYFSELFSDSFFSRLSSAEQAAF